MMSVFWGMFIYSLAVLGTVLGLAIKLALLYIERGELRRQLDESDRRGEDLAQAIDGLKKVLERYRKEVKVLYEELEKSDLDAGTGGVADRLRRLLSGEMSENDSKAGEGGSAVSASTESRAPSG